MKSPGWRRCDISAPYFCCTPACHTCTLNAAKPAPLLKQTYSLKPGLTPGMCLYPHLCLLPVSSSFLGWGAAAPLQEDPTAGSPTLGT